MRIGCLHTADSNQAVFDAACRALNLGAVTLRHRVRADLLAAAEQAGGLTTGVAGDTLTELQTLAAQGADAVLLTCSTLGPVVTPQDADPSPRFAPVPVLRVDAALAQAAVRQGGRVAVLYAVETTLGPTQALFAHAAQATGATIAMTFVPGAWAAFKAGRRDEYLDRVAAAADAAYAGGAPVVALAQASMASAAERCRRGMPLTSPGAGLQAAVALALRRTPPEAQAGA